jgi:uncharacterized protein
VARWAITGGTGMIGSQLCEALIERGDEVVVLTRGAPRAPRQIQWNIHRGVSSPSRLEGLDGVFHLAGAPIGNRPWTRRRRQELWDSRVRSTDTLLADLAKLNAPPKVIVGAGHLGVFGDRGEDILDEGAAHGTGFLADLSKAWEEAQLEAPRVVGCRAAVLRMSIVLSARGGPFPLIVKPFRYGIGGWLGTGKQWTPWISDRDAVGAMIHLATTDGCEGTFNGASPATKRNYEWCRALGRAVGHPVRTHAPKWALRGALGELADGVFLSSLRCVPAKLMRSGYNFQDVDLEDTFGRVLAELEA